MYHLLLVFQVVSILAVFVEAWVVFLHWKGMLQAYLFFACAATIVNNIGYLMQMMANNREEAFTSIQMSYLGRVWIGFALLLFTSELVRFHLSRAAKIILAFINSATFVVVLTTKTTKWYYQRALFAKNGDYAMISLKPGFWHHIWTVMMTFYLLFGLFLLVRAMLREKNAIAKKRLLLVICSILVQGISVVLQMLRVLPVSENYDISMLSFPIGAVFMLIAILRYRLFDAESMAREYVDDELTEGVFALDERGQVGFSNRTARELFPDLIRHPDKISKKMDLSIERSNPLSIGDRIYTPFSKELIQRDCSVGRLYVLKDDTEHYRYMAELSEQKQIADNANRAKSSFLASMSHEIRTPINAVLGMDEMILRESHEPETLSYAEDIRTAGETLLSLINDILDFSKIEEGRMEILPTQYELSSVINDLVNMIRGRAEKKGLRFELKVDKNTPHLLYGDEIRIRQIALNLLTNAVKYTETGTVSMEIGYREIGEPGVILLSFRVQDTGIGMKEEDMDKLFSPFERIEELRNRSIEGSGLGMSIVKQLLAMMDSKLEVDSVYGEGSVFSFEVRQEVIKADPIGDYTARASSDRRAYHELFHAPDAHILVVDDNETNLAVIKNLLKQTQLQVDTAGSGREAIALSQKNAYDVIFIDHMMPEIDGFETLQHMRENSVECTCIALTANAVSGAREMYLEAGFTDYLSKPVDSAQLEAMLKEYLPPEKVLAVDEATAADEAEDAAVLPDWLTAIPELDMDAGLNYGASPEGYLSILTVFHRTAQQKMQEIEEHFQQKNIKDYTILVHAIKSSARMIGANELSDLARQLEDAGKAENEEFIQANTDRLLQMYRELDEKLTPLDEEGPLEEIAPAHLTEAFQTMAEIAESMDYGLMEELIDKLRGYRLSDEDAERLEKISDALTRLEWDTIIQIVHDRN